MKNNNTGWFSTYRDLLSKPIWLESTSDQRSVLIALLSMAGSKEHKWKWNGEEFETKKGEMITSLQSIVEKSGKGVTVRNVRTALKRFEKLGFIKNKVKKKGRLISIVNGLKYHNVDKELINDKVDSIDYLPDKKEIVSKTTTVQNEIVSDTKKNLSTLNIENEVTHNSIECNSDISSVYTYDEFINAYNKTIGFHGETLDNSHCERAYNDLSFKDKKLLRKNFPSYLEYFSGDDEKHRSYPINYLNKRMFEKDYSLTKKKSNKKSHVSVSKQKSQPYNSYSDHNSGSSELVGIHLENFNKFFKIFGLPEGEEEAKIAFKEHEIEINEEIDLVLYSAKLENDKRKSDTYDESYAIRPKNWLKNKRWNDNRAEKEKNLKNDKFGRLSGNGEKTLNMYQDDKKSFLDLDTRFLKGLKNLSPFDYKETKTITDKMIIANYPQFRPSLTVEPQKADKAKGNDFLEERKQYKKVTKKVNKRFSANESIAKRNKETKLESIYYHFEEPNKNKYHSFLLENKRVKYINNLSTRDIVDNIEEFLIENGLEYFLTLEKPTEDASKKNISLKDSQSEVDILEHQSKENLKSDSFFKFGDSSKPNVIITEDGIEYQLEHQSKENLKFDSLFKFEESLKPNLIFTEDSSKSNVIITEDCFKINEDGLRYKARVSSKSNFIITEEGLKILIEDDIDIFTGNDLTMMIKKLSS